mgnify:CR=1 FL=1
MGEMSFSLRYLYPNLIGNNEETGQKANPEASDQEALNENIELDKKGDNNNASGKKILIGLVIIIGLVVLFGGGK